MFKLRPNAFTGLAQNNSWKTCILLSMDIITISTVFLYANGSLRVTAEVIENRPAVVGEMDIKS